MGAGATLGNLTVPNIDMGDSFAELARQVDPQINLAAAAPTPAKEEPPEVSEDFKQLSEGIKQIPTEPPKKETQETSDETIPEDFAKLYSDVGRRTSAKIFAQSTDKKDAEQFSQEDMDVMSAWTPNEWNEFKQARPDYPIPADKQREVFDAERAGTLKKPESPGFYEGMVKPFAAGVGKFATSLMEQPGLTPSEAAATAFGPAGKEPLTRDVAESTKATEDAEKAIRSYVASAVKLPVEDLPNLATKLATGGSSWSDWLSEKYLGSTPDDSFRRYQARQAVDTANGYLNRQYGNVYGRVVAHPAVQQGLASFVKLNVPGISDEQAAAAADQAAKEVGKTHDVDQDIETAGSFLLPEGLGMGNFGLAFMGLKAARGAKGLIRGATMSERAQQELAQKELGESVDKASKPGAFGIAAGKLADTTEKLQQAAADFAEKYPTLTGLGKYSAQYVPGAVLGYHSDPEHPFRNAFLGAAIERTGLGALTRLKLGEAAVAIPRTVQELGAARAISAGGRKGMFELAGAAPEASKLTQKLFEKSGKRWDKFGNFLKDVGREGVDVAAVTGALGILNSDDLDQMKENLQTGAGFVGLGRIMHAAMGQNPAEAARRIRQQDVDNYKTLQQLSPETQTHLRDIMDWDSVIAQRQTQLNAAVLGGDQGEIAAAAERLKQAQQANVATREAYARGVGNVVTGMHEILNGPFRVGQKTAAIEALTTDQIVDRLAANNPNVPRSELEAVARRGEGLYFPTGAREFTPGEDLPTALQAVGAKYTFDPLRATAVVNMDNVMERAHVTGRPFADALRHEWGHVLDAVPEFRELNAETDRMLFDTENRGLDGKVYSSTKGLFSDKDLVKMFTDEYLSHLSPEEIKNWASSQLLWDELGQKLNEKAVAEYMKAEVRADLNSMSFTGDNLNKLESWQQHVMDWARLTQQNTLVGKAINGIFGAGGRDPYATTETIATQAGKKFTPELLAAHRNAIRQLQKLNGMVSPTTTGEYTMPVLTKTQLIGNKALRERYGKDSGLFKTEFRATVFDKDGNVVGTTVVADPTATEGSWGMENGTLTQRSGFGNVPAGTTVPEGGSVKVSREIVMGPDGETPQVLSPKEIKQLVKTRAGLIRDALDNAYQGEPDGFRSVSEDGLTYRGTFTPEQIKAIRALPENVVPAKLKETILRINDLIAKSDGQRMLIDYAARMDDRGKYKPFSPKIYDLVPIGMHFSKDGNFLVTTISVTRLLDKLNLWSERLPNRLSPWGGNREAFFHQFVTDYLPNHLAGRPGETGLDADPKVALQKKNIFNDFLNLTNNDARMANPDRTVVPRKKGDPKGKDANRTIMSIRADAVADMLESTATPMPVDYGKQLMNYLPARETKAKQEEPIPFRVDEQNPILKALNVVTPRAANDDVRRISEEYVKGAGMPYRPHGQAIPVNEDLAKRIADHYEAEKDNPNAPEVKKAYTALANETVNQWKAFEKAGYTATPWTGEGQPYANSADMMQDVRDNKHLYYFTTEGGFGETGISDKMREENPMLAPSGVNFNGAENVPVNDVFRVVHDIVGHGANGYEFGPKGEFNAYLEHSRMFSDAAKPALAGETLAQNSWVNYGPHLRDEAGNLPKKGQPGYIAPQDRPFAQQKNIALPPEFIDAAEAQAGTKAGPSYLPAAGESRPVPTQEELDKMKARLPKYRVTSSDNNELGTHHIYLFDDKGKNIGSAEVKLHEYGNALEVVYTNVSPEYRGKGYGEALYREIAKYAQEGGADVLLGSPVSGSALKVRNKLFETESGPREEYGNAAESKVSPFVQYLPAKKLTVQHTSEEKEGSVGGDLDLVHFGAYGINTADPKKMGKGSATGIDRAGLPKTYFYLKGTPYEAGIKEQTPYLAKVDGNSIYDLDADPLGLKQTNREAMDKAIQDAGFAGYLSRKKKGQAFDAVAMFKKTKLTEAQPTDVFSEAEAKRRMEAGGPEIDYAAQDEAFYGPSYLPAQPTVTKGGHVVVTDPEKPFTATPEILTRFLPASPKVNLEDYTDYPIIALTADRMGVGKAYVGPEGAQKETKLPRQGGAGFPTIYFTKDKDNNPVWAFSDKGSASRFLTRGRNIAKERGVDKFLVAPTLLNANNHLHSPAGQSAYVDALNAAMEAGVIKPKQVDAHVKEILTRMKNSAGLSPQQKEVIGDAKSFADLSKLVSEKALNFAAGALLKEKASARTLPIKLEDMERMGILPSSVAKALAHEGFYDLPDYSIVSLFEVPVDQQPEEGDFHHAYPWIVRGTPIGFLKNIYNLADVTSDSRVFTKTGKINAHPTMMVMPALDPAKIKKALEDLKPIPAP